MKPITITEAGLKMAQAQENPQATLDALSAIVVNNSPGCGNYNENFREIASMF